MGENFLWTISLSAVGITGMWISGNGSKWGWFIGLCAQVLWITFAIVTRQYGLILGSIFYGAVNLRNLLKWRARERKSAVNS